MKSSIKTVRLIWNQQLWIIPFEATSTTEEIIFAKFLNKRKHKNHDTLSTSHSFAVGADIHRPIRTSVRILIWQDYTIQIDQWDIPIAEIVLIDHIPIARIVLFYLWSYSSQGLFYSINIPNELGIHLCLRRRNVGQQTRLEYQSYYCRDNSHNGTLRFNNNTTTSIVTVCLSHYIHQTLVFQPYKFG